MENFGAKKLSTAAALGAGVLLGAGSLYLYSKCHKEMNYLPKIKKLKENVKNLELEIQKLNKVIQRSKAEEVDIDAERMVSLVRNKSTSALSGSEEEEFFDCSDDSEGQFTNYASLDLESLIIKDEDYWKELDVLLDGNADDVTDAFQRLEQIKDECATDAGYYWRLSKAMRQRSVLAEQQGMLELKKDLTFKSCEMATRALELDDNNPEVHKWYAITLGSRSDYVDPKQRIEDGKEFLKHIQAAIDLNPLDPSLHHLAGRFQFELSELPWVERKLASVIFGSEVTVDGALDKFLKAEQYNIKDWKENKLFVGKCFLALGNTQEGISWVTQARDVPITSISDEVVQDDIMTILSKHTDKL